MNLEVTQAAIFCGGKGERLKPLTDTIPKPMVSVNGKPFLHHLLLQLKEKGIKRVILMTGYLGEQIPVYFGNGSSLGLDIQYSKGPVEWETGRRLYEIRSMLDEHFLLLYGDNFVPYSHRKNMDFYLKQGKLLSFIVQEKRTGNIRLAADKVTVEIYDKKRAEEGLTHVELGYMIASNRIFSYYDNIEVSFSDIIAKLVADRQVAGLEVKDRYYSISDIERLKLTSQYLTPKKILLIDRDGVINEKAPRGEYVSEWKDFRFIEDNVEGMKLFSEAGYSFIIISNQAGIGRGMVSASAVDSINSKMKERLEKEDIKVLAVYVCPHHWEDKCFCRKPGPGLFFKASSDFKLRLDKTYYIGDDPRDCQAAFEAGCGCVYTGNKEELQKLAEHERPDITANNLKEAAQSLLNYDHIKDSV